MAKFQINETIHSYPVLTVRLGTAGAGNVYTSKEVGKAVKLSADSAYTLCAIGDAIEGIVSSSEFENQGTQDGFSLGGIATKGYKLVLCEGSQAAGTGAIAVGDYVVAGTPVAKDTALAQGAYLKVRKATDQAVAKSGPFCARVVSLLTGAGAVGTVAVIEIL